MTPSLSKEERLSTYEDALLYAANDPLLRAWYAYYLEDIDKRIANVKIGLKRFPESSILNNMMAYFMMDKGDMDAAKNHLDVYMTVHPDEPNAYDSMGDLLLASGDTLQAKQMFEKAYQMSRDLTTGPEDFFNASKKKAEALN
jgi:tetratricopeptide (TPR) repeat protein